MPQRDMYHESVRQALIKDGWTITHDPYTLAAGSHNLYVDLGAERVIAAEKDGERIAVEIKSFVGRSQVQDLEQALGQYVVYDSLLQGQEPERELYLAVPQDAFDTVINSAMGRAVLEHFPVRLVVFDPAEEVIRQWKT